jgi:VanZ family protein
MERQGAAMPNKQLQPKQIVYLVLSLLTMAVIFFFSSQTGTQSGEVSGGVRAWLTEGIRAIFPEAVADFLLEHVRQMAHVFLYSCLSLFVTLFFSTFALPKKWLYFLLPIGVCFLYACSDEIHQLFVDGRSGSFRDVCIDGIGFVTVNLLTNLVLWLVRKNRVSKE